MEIEDLKPRLDTIEGKYNTTTIISLIVILYAPVQPFCVFTLQVILSNKNKTVAAVKDSKKVALKFTTRIY